MQICLNPIFRPVQRTTENILKESNKLSNEVCELKSSFRRLENELLATKTVLSDEKNANKELRIELMQLNEKYLCKEMN